MVFVIVLCAACGLGFILLTRRIVSLLEKRAYWELLRMKRSFKALLKKKEALVLEKGSVQREAHKIMALYDMAPEIVRKATQDEAFDIFQSKLRENVIFHDCQLWDTLPDGIKTGKDPTQEFFFPIKDGPKTAGHLVFKGVAPQDQDQALILSHQFAWALRRIWLYQKIDSIAVIDSLTELYTRRYFLERFEQELKRSKGRTISLSFLMMDVDHFKEFNDYYGHLTGDQILREIGKIIKANIREMDIAGRFGGEEFCVVLPETDRPGALLAAERLRLAVEKSKIRAYETVVQTTLSIGVANFPTDGTGSNELIDKADWALYRAKKAGRNRIGVWGDIIKM